jgi:surfeit locus 1 family protein
VVGLIVLFINLGFWQLRRLDERQAENARIEATAFGEPATLDSIVGQPSFDSTTKEWTLVRVAGVYRYDAELLLANQSLVGTIGYDVLTPLEQADGTFVIVDRGWVPFNEVLSRSTRPVAEWQGPTEKVTVDGWIRPGDRGDGERPDIPEGAGSLADLQGVDLAAFDSLVNAEPLPLVVQLRPTSDIVDLNVRPAPQPLPELTDGPHLGYAMQWFAFALMAMFGWPILVRSRLRKQNSRQSDIVLIDSLDTSNTEVDIDTPAGR